MSHPWQVQASARMASLGASLQPAQMSVPMYQQQQPPNTLFQQQPMYQQQQPPQLFQQQLSLPQQQQQIHVADKMNKPYDPNPVTYPFQTTSMPPPSTITLGANPGTLSMVSNMQSGLAPPTGNTGPSLMGPPSLTISGLSSMSVQPGAVTYPMPRRNLPPATINVPPPSLMSTMPNANTVVNPEQYQTRTRVFTGTINKLYDNFGFIDGDVFFQTSVCTGGLQPKLGDKAIVDATYNPAMPFKWNATRVQVIPTNQDYSNNNLDLDRGRHRQDRRRDSRDSRVHRSALKDREVEREAEREKRREERQRERDRDRERAREKESKKHRSRSPPLRRRSRSRSPPRRRPIPKYNVNVPKICLNLDQASVGELKRRYSNLYIPSDFSTALATWLNHFPMHKPLTFDHPSSFHVMHKEVDPVESNTAVIDPPDADFSFSAKVMLLSLPSPEDMYRKSCALAEENQDGDMRDGFVHPTRLINFLVGSKGKSDTMAIGGAWSPSLDGPNPREDESVLIKTAIRTCKALTGIDLSRCSVWYRFLELNYVRTGSSHCSRQAKLETVVIFLPDVWSCAPSKLEWEGLQQNYEKQLARIINGDKADAAGSEPQSSNPAAKDQKDEKHMENDPKKPEPTHFSKLEIKSMKVGDLRRELEARGLSSKGLTSQLVARLGKVLKSEQETSEEQEAAAVAAAAAAKAKAEAVEREKLHQAAQEREMDPKSAERKKKEDEERRRHEEREKQARERRYKLPVNPHIIVHPSRTAKSGRFDCTVMSLSLLLDYRAEDTKEHSFEVSLFAELFNEMLMRDFGFRIYKSLLNASQKPKDDDKDRRSKRKDESKENGDKKSEGSEDCGGKKKERDRREKIKMITIDPQLLLAFVYFDQTHCGYIFDRDMEEILYTLGINLSRAQIRKMLQKVLTRDTLTYRKLTDKPLDAEGGPENEADSEKEVEKSEKLARGVKERLPDFGSEAPSAEPAKPQCVPESGMATWRGAVLHVWQMKTLLDRNINLIQLIRSFRTERISTMRVLFAKSAVARAKVCMLRKKLNACKKVLAGRVNKLKAAQTRAGKYVTALKTVRRAINPFLKVKKALEATQLKVESSPTDETCDAEADVKPDQVQMSVADSADVKHPPLDVKQSVVDEAVEDSKLSDVIQKAQDHQDIANLAKSSVVENGRNKQRRVVKKSSERAKLMYKIALLNKARLANKPKSSEKVSKSRASDKAKSSKNMADKSKLINKKRVLDKVQLLEKIAAIERTRMAVQSKKRIISKAKCSSQKLKSVSQAAKSFDPAAKSLDKSKALNKAGSLDKVKVAGKHNRAVAKSTKVSDRKMTLEQARLLIKTKYNTTKHVGRAQLAEAVRMINDAKQATDKARLGGKQADRASKAKKPSK